MSGNSHVIRLARRLTKSRDESSSCRFRKALNYGSLFATLKAKGWAEKIMAGVGAGGLSDTSNCALFTATVKLTDEGRGLHSSTPQLNLSRLYNCHTATTQLFPQNERSIEPKSYTRSLFSYTRPLISSP